MNEPDWPWFFFLQVLLFSFFFLGKMGPLCKGTTTVLWEKCTHRISYLILGMIPPRRGEGFFFPSLFHLCSIFFLISSSFSSLPLLYCLDNLFCNNNSFLSCFRFHLLSPSLFILFTVLIIGAACLLVYLLISLFRSRTLLLLLLLLLSMMFLLQARRRVGGSREGWTGKDDVM